MCKNIIYANFYRWTNLGTLQSCDGCRPNKEVTRAEIQCKISCTPSIRKLTFRLLCCCFFFFSNKLFFWSCITYSCNKHIFLYYNILHNCIWAPALSCTAPKQWLVEKIFFREACVFILVVWNASAKDQSLELTTKIINTLPLFKPTV